jgi:hypothetical protein
LILLLQVDSSTDLNAYAVAAQAEQKKFSNCITSKTSEETQILPMWQNLLSLHVLSATQWLVRTTMWWFPINGFLAVGLIQASWQRVADTLLTGWFTAAPVLRLNKSPSLTWSTQIQPASLVL